MGLAPTAELPHTRFSANFLCLSTGERANVTVAVAVEARAAKSLVLCVEAWNAVEHCVPAAGPFGGMTPRSRGHSTRHGFLMAWFTHLSKKLMLFGVHSYRSKRTKRTDPDG